MKLLALIVLLGVSAAQDCTLDESENSRGANQCWYDSECAGDRYCSSGGWCSGESNCPVCISDDSVADVDGDTCSALYDNNPVGCGNYDSEDFIAARDCCGCGGGSTGNYVAEDENTLTGIGGACDADSACVANACCSVTDYVEAQSTYCSAS